MKITVTSVLVDDQDKALQFYTDVLGFVKKHDIPMGKFRWLTVTSPDSPDGVELILEPDENPASKAFKQSLFEQGIPLTMFYVDDIDTEHARLAALGVDFKMAPTATGNVKLAILNDTCGNWIQIYQMQ
ncbi:VOC family protein [Mucilaginibacter sp.]|uniref:VOC family protein n=1 Tax=Mucilaginibacter sp. TaxID=1882438 RepID=UPI0035BC63B8